MPGVQKKDIRINAYEGSIEIIAVEGDRKYKRAMELPADLDIDAAARSTFSNGLLEITFEKRKKPQRKVNK